MQSRIAPEIVIVIERCETAQWTFEEACRATGSKADELDKLGVHRDIHCVLAVPELIKEIRRLRAALEKAEHLSELRRVELDRLVNRFVVEMEIPVPGDDPDAIGEREIVDVLFAWAEDAQTERYDVAMTALAQEQEAHHAVIDQLDAARRENAELRAPWKFIDGDFVVAYWPATIVANGWQPYDQPHADAYLPVAFDRLTQFDLPDGGCVLVSAWVSSVRRENAELREALEKVVKIASDRQAFVLEDGG